MAVPETPKTFVDQMQEQIANLNTEEKWKEFKDAFNTKLSDVKDSLTPEQLVNIQKSLEAKWNVVKTTANDQMKASRDILRNVIDFHLQIMNTAGDAIGNTAAEASATAKTAVGAVIGGSALGKGLDMMSNILESIGKVASDVWEYLKPYLEKFASTPFVKFFIGEEGERKLQAWLGINPDDEKVKKEIINRLPNNVELVPDTANKKNDKVAMIRFNDIYDSLANNKPASKGLFFSLIITDSTLNPAPTTPIQITLTQIADVAAKYVTKQQPPIAAPATAPATPSPATTPATPAPTTK